MLHLHRLARPSLLALALVASAPAVSWAKEPSAPVPHEQNGSSVPLQPLPLDELRTFAEALDRIKSAYVEPISDQELLQNAIKGMVNNLDPHSAYLEPDAFNELQEMTSGEFGGLGVEVSSEDDVLKVIAPIDDTPAAAAGIEAGDLIVKIDDVPTKGQSMLDSIEKLRGKPGEPITLSIVRNGKPPFDVTLIRDVIKVKSVKSELIEPGYGLIRISQFQITTGDEVARALNSLRATNSGQPLKGLVLDLRNNPGGVLQSAVEVADQFLDGGLIVYTQGRLENSEIRFNADKNDLSGGVPLVVLINGGSASASEIVAGALQDHHRATIMGTDSFGKGSVQTVLPLSNDRALKLTTALYFTPNGRSIQAQGIAPDITVKRASDSKNESVREADLSGHLGNASGGAEVSSKQLRERNSQALPAPASGDGDPQLQQALIQLKAKKAP